MTPLVNLILVALCAASTLPPDHAEKMRRGLEIFKKEAAPLLREHCVKCHGGEKTKSDFDLTTREGLLLGGQEGEVVKPFQAGESRLMKLLRHEEEPAMPDKNPKLPEELISKIAAWIDLGAPYDAPLIEGRKPPRDKAIVSTEDRQWWAFQPLVAVRPPAGSEHPVDAFLEEAAISRGLKLNEAADPRTLIRRVTLDLTGLPPTPGEVEEFLKNPAGLYEGVLDRLLSSTAYGERWARHWLDVARFAESSGFEHDYDRPNAFHYRDFVIRALNADLPFDRFTRWQIAGDEFEPENPEALMATGFLGAGVFPTQITANEVERTRYDALDDMLSTTSSAFLGLTVGCARCHDHKFDPIPTQDYYRMLSTFTTTVRSEVELDLNPAESAKALATHEEETKRLTAALVEFEKRETLERFNGWLGKDPRLPEKTWNLVEVESIISKAGAKFQKLQDGSWLAQGKNGASDTYTVTARTTLPTVTGIKLEALTHDSAPHKGPGRADNGNFALSRIRVMAQASNGSEPTEVKLVSPQATHEQNKEHLSVNSSLDEQAKSGWAVDGGGIGKDQAASYTFSEPVPITGGSRFVITLEFGVNTGHNLIRPRFSMSTGPVPDLRSISLPEEIASLASRLHSLTETDRAQLFHWWKESDPEWRERKEVLRAHVQRVPKTKSPVLICAEGHKPVVMHSQGAPFFEQTHLLKRGDPNQKLAVAAPGFLQVLMRGADEKKWQWSPPAEAPYSGRRRSLANWMTDMDHGAGALMARVAVNRVWQHHFGRGLVATPNDFGKTGALPSNPALLDWLAGEFIGGGWKLKPLHRLIMTSRAYQQSSIADEAKVAADPDNALFLRRIPQRLESEAVRDSILAVSGELDRRMFGAGTMEEESRRRSIYFTIKRSRLMNSMVVFDAPEPLTSQGTRPVTTVAPQALLLMNSPQTRRAAEAFAVRVEAMAKGNETGQLVTQAYLLALARPPRPMEREEASAFINAGIEAYHEAGITKARTLALTDFCHTVLGLNEFVYVD